jgi:hypothetical protein
MTFGMSFGYSTCPECDEHVPYGRTAEHECDRERWLSFQVTRARSDIESIDQELARYLNTARGRFELWYAERARLCDS